MSSCLKPLSKKRAELVRALKLSVPELSDTACCQFAYPDIYQFIKTPDKPQRILHWKTPWENFLERLFWLWTSVAPTGTRSAVPCKRRSGVLWPHHREPRVLESSALSYIPVPLATLTIPAAQFPHEGETFTQRQEHARYSHKIVLIRRSLLP